MYGLLSCLFWHFATCRLSCLFVAIVWWISAKSTKEKYGKHLVSFHLIILGCGILLLLAREVINKYYMPNAIDPVRISAKLTVLVLIILFYRNILKTGWSKKSRLLTAVFVLFILVPFVYHRFISTEQVQSDDSSSPANLGNLGYVEWGPAGNNIDKVSVTEYDPNLTFDGLNLYTVTKSNWVLLIDMTGNTVHKWSLAVPRKISLLSEEAHAKNYLTETPSLLKARRVMSLRLQKPAKLFGDSTSLK